MSTESLQPETKVFINVIVSNSIIKQQFRWNSLISASSNEQSNKECMLNYAILIQYMYLTFRFYS